MEARFSSTLRSVVRSEWLRISASVLVPPAAEYSRSATAVSLWRITSSTCWTTWALVSPMRAIRSAMSGCWRSGRRASTCAASVVSRLASTSAIVCGDSLRSIAALRSGGTRCRNSNGGRSVRADSRPRTSAARSGPSARSITPRAKSTPPATSESPSGQRGQLGEDRVGGFGADGAQARHFHRQALDFVLAQQRQHVRGALGAERGHQHGRLARAGQLLGLGGRGQVARAGRGQRREGVGNGLLGHRG